MTDAFKVSITELVQLCCASGDLINTGPPGPTALQGQLAHKKLQAKRSDHLQAEVKLSTTVLRPDASITLSGRVDLMDEDSDPPHIIEIKSCVVAPSKLPQSQSDQHWAQLFFYGLCLLQQREQTPQVQLSVHWVNISDDRVHEDSRWLSRQEIVEFCEPVLERFIRFQQLLQRHRREAAVSLEALQFPFGQFRPGQRTMATAVYRSIRDQDRLLSEAPTGIGKTISTLFPALKALGEGHGQSLYYLTAKNSGRQAADNTVKLLRSGGLAISSIQLSAKQGLCHCSNGSCERTDEGHCPLTLGFFDRLPAAREELLSTRHLDVAALDSAAHKHQLCPFELSLQMIPWMDLVICDYNYVFDPLVRLTQVMERSKHISLLVDEAHNLVDRARGMYSAELSRLPLMSAAKSAAEFPKLAKRLRAVASAIKRSCGPADTNKAEQDSPPNISRAVSKALEEFTTSLEGQAFPAELVEPFKALFRYAVIDELYGEHHRALLSSQAHDHSVRLACLNATDKLQTSFRSFHSAVCFSATLSPSQVYRTDLGLPDTTLQQKLDSPFCTTQLGCYVCTNIDTRWAAREASANALIELCAQTYRAKPGNYLVFFPSYQYLQQIKEGFDAVHPDIETLAQERSADPEQREAFREVFSHAGHTLGFAILGGVFSEGVDFLGESLLGAIIVGTGLSSISLEQKLIQADYDQAGLDGFDNAFKYPGMTRVLQAAGRVIRSETDRGVIVLADNRFQQAFYRQLMPHLWQPQTLQNPEQLADALGAFWRA